ncbi:hypothetical protein EW026_g7063 [Hermanssonia centrifuga]|uniref:non-specific serine/threonine protein kinase n=1 Tax=Hermanssonia centrifuga TaxID=98765 RepID=A0A4S4K918_9APHY|nr:hypothetical protein EW026_g7063 [Hermanssonia centrifuga]
MRWSISVLTNLNKGSYGTAYAARDVSTSQVLCAKVCLKKRVREGKDFIRGMVTELRAYKRIAASEEGLRTWLMELHGVVQDPERVIFMMALGIDALHSIGIIHRDIKPENILLSAASSDVRIRITDFTNSWIAPGDTADEWQRAYDVAPGSPLEWWRVYSKRYIGTKEYLAPEIRKKQWYGIMVDWWSLGCLAYDLIAGDALFPDDRSVNFYYKWEAEKTTSPYVLYRAGFLEEDEASMMSGLLNLEPHSRFRLQHLKKHPFFVDRRTRHNVFDELRGPPSSPTIPSLGGSDELAVHYTLEEEPMCYAAPEPYREDGMPASKAQVMFDQFGWINPNGMWAHR